MRIYPFWSAALFALAVFISAPAFALSVDHETGLNTDGTAKFADPDEQMPGFMTPPPDAPSSPQTNSSVTLPMTSGGSGPAMNFSVNHFGGSSQPDAFDQAYGRK